MGEPNITPLDEARILQRDRREVTLSGKRFVLEEPKWDKADEIQLQLADIEDRFEKARAAGDTRAMIAINREQFDVVYGFNPALKAHREAPDNTDTPSELVEAMFAIRELLALPLAKTESRIATERKKQAAIVKKANRSQRRKSSKRS